MLRTAGWLSLIALRWLDATARELDGVPGIWWADDAGVHVLAAAADELFDADTHEPVDGTRTTAAPEGGSSIVALFGGADHRRVAVEAIRRTGRAGVRIRDSHAAALTEFTGVPTFDHADSWVIDGPVRWADQPTTAVVGAAQPGLRHEVPVVGEIDVEHDGQVTTLRLTGSREHPALLFTDTATTIAPWRVLHLEPESLRSDGLVRLDLTRTVNLPFAFSDAGTCPRPLDGNHLPFAVTAGEKAPR